MKNQEKITLIATHANADLDGLASMLAAQKLYPNSKIVFHHEGEKLLRRFILQSLSYLFNMIPLKEIQNYEIDKIVLVDTRQKERLGKLSCLLDLNNIPVHIYDHHEPTSKDIKADKIVYEEVGATATIMTNILIEKNIDINPEEATILSLGIYEDTGSFTFNSTTSKDLKTAGILKDLGADTQIISDLLSRELSPEQLTLLNDMVKSSITYNLANYKIIISSVSRDEFIQNISLLTHKLNRMEQCDAIFVAARMAGKITLSARSNNSEINIGKIMNTLGGGGHAGAGAATISKITLVELKDKLIEEVRNYLNINFHVKDLMSSPPIKISMDKKIEEAAGTMTKYNINALLVIDSQDKLKGIISRQIVEKIKYHQITNVPVTEYMTTDFMEIDEDATITEAEEKIILNQQRILPVKNSSNELTGVFTRTDLLNYLITQDDKSHFIKDSKLHEISPGTRTIRHILEERLPQDIISLLEDIGVAADENNLNAYVVGGFVRDLLICAQKKDFDIDIVVEGDGILFAQNLATRLNAKISPHAKFKTAVITLPTGLKLDIATARTEFYDSPAALPKIEMSSLKLDLYRRDFTINTLAVHLNQNKFGTLIDYFFARKDLKDKVIRIIHSLSFVEDPTRIFRAVRFEQRFGFKIGKFTEKLIKNAIDMEFFEKLSGPRVFTELKYILMEENPLPALKRLNSFRLFQGIDKELDFTKRNQEIIESAKKIINWYSLNRMDKKIEPWIIFFQALVHTYNKDLTEKLCEKFKLPPKKANLFTNENFKAKHIIKEFKTTKNLENSTIYSRLSQISTETILYLMAITKDEKIKANAISYLTVLTNIKPSLTGKDLKEIGIKQGPIFGQILNSIMLAKMDGKINTLKDEFDFAKRYL